MLEVLGKAGEHARSAIGVAELPFDLAVEIEALRLILAKRQCRQRVEARSGEGNFGIQRVVAFEPNRPIATNLSSS